MAVPQAASRNTQSCIFSAVSKASTVAIFYASCNDVFCKQLPYETSKKSQNRSDDANQNFKLTRAENLIPYQVFSVFTQSLHWQSSIIICYNLIECIHCLTPILILQGISSLTNQALDGIVASLAELHRSMTSWGVSPPQDGWKTWSISFKNAKKDAKLSMQEEGMIHISHWYFFPLSLVSCLHSQSKLT